MADLVEHALALYREIADAGSAREPSARHVAFEPTEIELQRLDLELLRRRIEIAGADHELGDQAGKRLIAGWEICGRCPQAAAEVFGSRAGRGRGEGVVEVDLREPSFAFVGQREAEREERALALLSRNEGARRIGALVERVEDLEAARPSLVPAAAAARPTGAEAIASRRVPGAAGPRGAAERRGRRDLPTPVRARQEIVDQVLPQPQPARHQLRQVRAQH